MVDLVYRESLQHAALIDQSALLLKQACGGICRSESLLTFLYLSYVNFTVMPVDMKTFVINKLFLKSISNFLAILSVPYTELNCLQE